MPSPTTSEEFLDLVRKSGVVDDKRLAAHLDKLRGAGQLAPEPVRLATQLVRDGVLTHFQAEQFLQGKWRRFTIGKYKVLERLGSGGMGSVYLCEHLLMRRRVAVKVLPANKTEDNSSLERFYREARAVAALDHPNIVRAYDIDQDENLHFLVMEHVDGSSLQEIIKRAGPMDVLRACHYIRQAALGLQHAHDTAGLVHRDIKPGNVLVDRNGIVKILDMGLARFFHDQEDILTKKYDENVLGTADYLAPEQALDSHGVDIRADLYSLGATFYFCLTGRTPFSEGTVAQKFIWHQTRQPKPIRSLRPEVPEGVIGVLEKMMAKDKEQRYQTPLAVADALAPWTQTPIPPPPDNEMPQFSLAAAGPTPGASTLTPSALRNTAELSPAPRKVWQVPPAPPAQASDNTAPASPAPGATPANLAPRPSPARAAVAQALPAAVRPALNPSSDEARPVATAVTAQPVLNGNGRTAPAEVADVAWPLADQTAVAPAGERGPARRRAPPPGRAASGAPGPLSRQAILWLVLAGLFLLSLPALGFFAYWVLSSPGPRKGDVKHREPLRVNPAAGQKLAKAVRQAREGDTIYLQGDLAEHSLSVTAPDDLTIEPEPGKTVVWKMPPSRAPDGTEKKDWIKLLTVTASNFRLKGLTLDGDNRADVLIQLYGNCPGTRLEGLKLRGARKYGILCANCVGTKDHPVQLLNLHFHTPEGASGLYFESFGHTQKQIPRNRFFAIRDCTFEGHGHKVRASKRTHLDPATVELPATLEVGP